jgi:hypothetical protein
MGNKVDHIIVERASEMRKNPTEEENKMWHIILKHIKPRFIRQKIIGYYIVDFYCPKLKLIIEIDGEQHYIDENKDKLGVSFKNVDISEYSSSSIFRKVMSFKNFSQCLIRSILYCSNDCKNISSSSLNKKTPYILIASDIKFKSTFLFLLSKLNSTYE